MTDKLLAKLMINQLISTYSCQEIFLTLNFPYEVKTGALNENHY